MKSRWGRLLALGSVLVLMGGGCTLPFMKNRGPAGPPASADEAMKADTSGKSLSDQADIVVDAALEESSFEADAAGDAEADASLFTSDEGDLDNLESSYDESEL